MKVRLQMNTVKKPSCDVEAFNLELGKYGSIPNSYSRDFAKVTETIQ